MKSNTSSQLRLIIKASSSSIESCRSPPFSYQALAASRLESLRRFQRTRNTLWTFPSKDIPADYFPFSLQGIAFTILVLFGKFCAAGAFTILHIATAELYPTAIRFFHQLEVQMSTVGILKTPFYVETRCLASAPQSQGWAASLLLGSRSTCQLRLNFEPTKHRSLHRTPIMEDRRRCNQPKNPTPILLQGSLSAAVPLYIFGAASSLAGVVAALGLTESLGSPLPNNFEVTHDPILDCTPVLTTNPI